MKAIIFDCFGVLVSSDPAQDEQMLSYIRGLATSYHLGVVSNSSQAVLQERLADYGDTFKAMITPTETGLSKHDPSIFKFAAYQLGYEPEDCIFVDDVPTYCRTAEEASLTAIEYDNFDQFKTDLERLINT